MHVYITKLISKYIYYTQCVYLIKHTSDIHSKIGTEDIAFSRSCIYMKYNVCGAIYIPHVKSIDFPPPHVCMYIYILCNRLRILQLFNICTTLV